MKTPHRQSLKPGQTLIFGAMLLLGTGSIALAAIVSDVRASKHNLSAAADGSATRTGTVPVRTVKATGETQVCVFCHTPHGATSGIAAPLWNRALSTAMYTAYLSSSMDANPPPNTEPGAGSKVCLSCHDGTLAIGMVSALNATKNVAIDMSGTGFMGQIPGTAIETGSGFTRNLGMELGNDHPISFAYDNVLGGPGGTDGELRVPPVMSGATTVVGNRTPGVKPTFPLVNDQLQCPTCHDPHLSDTVAGNPPLKFLRGNRLQTVDPTGGAYSATDDIMCLACHDKAGIAWSDSAHANQQVADQAYKDPDANVREFPLGTLVWQSSCLSCHDTHTVQGARRLLREGTSSLLSPKSGGDSAIEETCFQCHSGGLNPTILVTPNVVPDIKSDFNLSFRMPITIADQGVANEPHDIGGSFDESVAASGGARCNTAPDQCGKDFVESRANLGLVASPTSVDLAQRHAECTDCHNPHRVTKNRLFNDDAATPGVAGTHKHNIALGDTVAHSNIASGSLRGSYGVEPSFALSANEFGANPSSFAVKRGDVPVFASLNVSSSHVTREYQICLKCHSNYAYDTLTGPPNTVGNPPPLQLGNYGGSTSINTNGMEYYSDVAMELQAPTSHQGTATPGDSGADPAFTANNQRSWHPVMDKTGRDLIARGNAGANLWRTPWNGSNVDGGANLVSGAILRDGTTAPVITSVGSQTMHCSDCHGSDNAVTDGSNPSGGEDGKSWGPHGSGNAFLLKGQWNTAAAAVVGADLLCFRCHEETQYADATGAPPTMSSGFGHATNLDPLDGITPLTNMHQRHAYYATLPPAQAPNWPVTEVYRCTLCHTGTAHGWKNKGFLVNLNDLGWELNIANGTPPGGAVPGGAVAGDIAPGPVVLAVGAAVPKGTQAGAVPYTNGPYYQGAYLRIRPTGFAASGNWVKADCAGCH